MQTAIQKETELIAWLRQRRSVALAYSGGVDSTYLLRLALDTLGADNVRPMLIAGQLHSEREGHQARALAHEMGAELHVLHMSIDNVPGLRDNTPERCYLCKAALFKQMRGYARASGYPTLIDGTNADDAGDYRPGMRALAEMRVESPLQKFGFTKADIRERSRALGLPTADKPALACLATRIPFGTRLEDAVMRRIDQAEGALIELGFAQVRVRAHGNVARIELPACDIEKAASRAAELAQAVKDCGFDFAALDLEGYRTGSLNPKAGDV